MKLILASLLLVTACAQISPERAAAKAEQDRLNNEQYLEEKYEDERLCSVLGCEEFYNEKGELIDVN